MYESPLVARVLAAYCEWQRRRGGGNGGVGYSGAQSRRLRQKYGNVKIINGKKMRMREHNIVDGK